MTKKEDDLGMWAIIGAAGAAAVGLLINALGQMGPPKFPGSNPIVNSYQATTSYTPPSLSPPKQGGCGCKAGR